MLPTDTWGYPQGVLEPVSDERRVYPTTTTPPTPTDDWGCAERVTPGGTKVYSGKSVTSHDGVKTRLSPLGGLQGWSYGQPSIQTDTGGYLQDNRGLTGGLGERLYDASPMSFLI